MAQSPGPLTKPPPTLFQSSTDDPGAAPQTEKSAPSPQWPCFIPSLEQAMRVVTGVEPPPAELRESTGALLPSLSFVETAALHEQKPSEEATAVRRIVAVRWRLMSALELRPDGNDKPDQVALDQLLMEIDGALASINELKRSEDADLRETCDAVRSWLARGVHKLLPTSTGALALGSVTVEVKQLRNVLAAASKAERGAPSALRAARGNKKALAIIAAGIIASASGAYTALKALREEQLPPVPTLPDPPPNTEVLGDAASGTVILRATNGKPIDAEALRHFKSQAIQGGAAVQNLSPTQVLITSGHRER
jgi:hypothetical protein